MSTFTWPVRIANLDGERSMDIDAFIDTGASMTTLPAPMLRELGVEPVARQQFTIANWQRIERDIGYAVATIGDQSLITYVAFGDEDSPLLLGALTLEVFALAVDPRAETLVPRELIMY